MAADAGRNGADAAAHSPRTEADNAARVCRDAAAADTWDGATGDAHSDRVGLNPFHRLATDAAVSPSVLIECIYYAADPHLLTLIRLLAALGSEKHPYAEEQLRALLREREPSKH
jgi:hypothetical protein